MEWLRSCYVADWKLFRGSDVLTRGYYWFCDPATPFYPGAHLLWSRNWVTDDFPDATPVGEQPGNRQWYNGRKLAVLVPPPALVGSSDCVAGGDDYPPPAGLAYIDGADSRCWQVAGLPPQESPNVIETVKVCDGSVSQQLVSVLCFDPVSQFTLTPGSGGQGTVGQNGTGSGPVVRQVGGQMLNPVVGQRSNGDVALNIIRAADVAPAGPAVQVLSEDGSTVLFELDVLGKIVVGSIAAALVTGLAPSATTDTTNAGNISGGTLPVGRLPSGGFGSGVTAYSGAATLAGVGTTQAGAAAIATDTVRCTASAGNTAVRLPSSPGYARILVTADGSNGANTLLIFPPSGGKFQALGTNVALGLGASQCVLLCSDRADNSLWRMVANVGT